MSQTEQQQSESNFPMASIAIDFLRKSGDGEEQMRFCEQGKEALAVGLDALFESGLPPAPALSELLGLAAVLEDERSSPKAAGLIRDAVTADPRALRALGILQSDRGSLRRASTRLLGSAGKAKAPVFGSAAPEGAVSLATMIDPMQMERARLGTAPASTPRKPTPTPSPTGTGGGKAPMRRKFGVS